MVKREKSPEIADDARYFTVYQPYPLSQTWEDEDTQKECAAWIAECIGQRYLWAIHTKPSARNMIILEISRSFEDHSKLLGEHRWKDFLKDPTEEEKERFSQVFHSFYSRGRDAQKDGWKPIVVENSWFSEWQPGKDRIVQPYPATHWCSTPLEDKTQKMLCRPLPVEQKLPPPRPQAVVVGSKDWVAKQIDGPHSRATLTKAWSRGATPTSSATSLPAETERTSSGASTPSIQTNSPLPSAPASPANRPGKTKWGRTMPLQKFVNDAVRSNNKLTGWAALPTKSSGKFSLTEGPPKESVNAWAKPLLVPEARKSKPAPTTTYDSKGKAHNDYPEWSVKDSPQSDMYKNTDLPKDSNSSAVGTFPASPHKGRNRSRKETKDDKRWAHKDDPSEETERQRRLHRESSSRTPGQPQVPESDGKRSRWDVPGPEKSTKHLPKPWDKKKKEKETVETMEFGAPLDWSAYKQRRVSDDEPMDVDGEDRDKYDSRDRNGDNSRNNRYQEKNVHNLPESSERKNKDRQPSYNSDDSYMRTGDDESGQGYSAKYDHGAGKGSSKSKKSKAKKEKPTEQPSIEVMFSGVAIHGSTESGKDAKSGKGMNANALANVPPVEKWGTTDPAPTKEEVKRPEPISFIGKWDPSPPTSSVDDFHDWGHAPHKKRLAAMKRAAEAQASEQDKNDVDMDKVSEVPAPHNKSKKDDAMDDSPAEVGVTNSSGPSTHPTRDTKMRKSNFFHDTPMDQDANSLSSNVAKWAPDPNESSSKGKGKERAATPDDLGTRLEDWGLEPEPESSSAPLSAGALHDDSVNWNAPQGNKKRRGLAPDLISGDLNETELYAWERETPAQAADHEEEAPRMPLANKYLKNLKCPTHNYYCKKSICKDMARLVKEEEYKDKMGIGFIYRGLHDYRRAPTRPRGSKRGPRVRHKKGPSTLGHLRGFESENDSEDAGEDKTVGTHKANEKEGETNVKEEEPVSSSKLDTSNDWGVPIGSNLNEWGM